MNIIWIRKSFGSILVEYNNYRYQIYLNSTKKTGIPSDALKKAMQSISDDLNMPMLSPIENVVISEIE